MTCPGVDPASRTSKRRKSPRKMGGPWTNTCTCQCGKKHLHEDNLLKMGPFMVKADASSILPGFITVVEVTFLMPPRLKSSLILSTCDALFFFFFLRLRSICLQYKQADFSNREYVYNKNDKNSSWQERFGVGLMWAAKWWVGVLNLCPPASRDHSSGSSHNHQSHLVMLSGQWKMLEAVWPRWGD